MAITSIADEIDGEKINVEYEDSVDSSEADDKNIDEDIEDEPDDEKDDETGEAVGGDNIEELQSEDIMTVEVEDQLYNASQENWMWPVETYEGYNVERHKDGAIYTALDLFASNNRTMIAAKSGTVIEVYSGCNNHSGIDNGKCMDRNICSPNFGVVRDTTIKTYGYCNFGFGNGIVVRADDGTYYSYAHMNSVSVSKNQHINQGDPVGLVGDAGFSQGTHCHFEIASSATTSGSGWYNFTHLNPAPDFMGGNISYVIKGSSSGPISTTIYSSLSVTNIGENTAKIESSLNQSYWDISECGYYIGTSESNMTKGSVIDRPAGSEVKYLSYALSGLSPGTTYYYEVYAVRNGTTYWTGKKTFTTTGTPFYGSVDVVKVYPGMLECSGWAFDKASPTSVCEIQIYVDDTCYGIIQTAELREDVKNKYSQTTNNQGFHSIWKTSIIGEHTLRIYVVNGSKKYLLDERKVTLKENVPPTISDVKVTDISSTGYTVTCKVTDSLQANIKSIQFRTTANGKTTAYKDGSFDGTTATFKVDIKDFSNYKGTYQTEICATDYNGASTTAKTSNVTIDDPLMVKSHSLILGGTIGLNFDMYIPKSLRSDSGAYVMINGEKYLISSATKSGDYYRFTYKVNAKEMYDNCTLTVYDKNGKKVNIENSSAVNGSYVYSVGKYLDETISKSSDTNMISLAKAMRYYGYAAQYYFGYNTSKAGTLPNYSNIDLSSYRLSTTGKLPEGLSYSGSSLLLNNNTSLKHYFSVDSNHSVSEYKFKVDGTTVTPVKTSDNIYCITISGIPANKLSTAYSLSINDSYSMTYGPMSYAYKALGKNDSNALAKLMYAMEEYSRKAESYFGK